MNAPLFLTKDPDLRDALARLAAAAGVTPQTVTDPESALRHWSSASIVLVGAELAAEVAAWAPPRRSGLHLVGHDHLPDHAFRDAVALGADNVAELPRSDAWLLEVLADAAEGPARAGLTVGVVGGSGGAGATTFACALAEVAGRHRTACLIDLDAFGPGADRVLGMDHLDGVRWDSLQQTTGRLSARALRDALPRRRDVSVLTWSPGPQAPVPAFAAREALAAAVRGHDLVVLDLPRAGGDVADELMARCHHLVVVVRNDLPGLGAAARFVAHAGRSGPVAVVLRGAGAPASEVARVVGAPVLAEMADQRGLGEAVDLGLGPVRARRGVLARAAEEALASFGEVAAGSAA